MAAEVKDRGIEVAAVDEEVAVRAQLAGKHAAHGVWLHYGEGSGGLDRHVHAAVLPEFVAGIGQCGRRVFFPYWG